MECWLGFFFYFLLFHARIVWLFPLGWILLLCLCCQTSSGCKGLRDFRFSLWFSLWFSSGFFLCFFFWCFSFNFRGFLFFWNSFFVASAAEGSWFSSGFFLSPSFAAHSFFGVPVFFLFFFGSILCRLFFHLFFFFTLGLLHLFRFHLFFFFHLVGFRRVVRLSFSRESLFCSLWSGFLASPIFALFVSFLFNSLPLFFLCSFGAKTSNM